MLYCSKLNPFLGRNFEAMHPLEWLARMSDHIPDRGQHRTLFYGEYANRVRSERHPPEECPVAAEPPRKRCSPSWARLIAKVYQVDPLLCTRCGQRMSIVAFLTDAFAIRKILDHLGLSTPEVELHLLGCRQGIAIVEDKVLAELNPNVAMEWGWMRGMGRRVLHLVEKDFQKARADWSGLIENNFDWANPAPDIDAAVKAFLARKP